MRFLDVVRHESARFLTVMREVDPDRVVPSCPDWNAADLVWHLGEVQWFWETVVRRGVTDEDQLADLQRTDRPDDYGRLLLHLEECSAQLVRTLGRVPAGDRRYMWTHDPALHTVGYITRRQAHEALIHRVDAELTAGLEPGPFAPELAVDGVDEIVDVMRGGPFPDWATFSPAAARTVQLVADDTGDVWVLQLGTFAGVTPSGVEVSEHGFQRIPPDQAASATVRGRSTDLLLWLWNRPTAGPIDRSGDPDALTSLDYAVNEDLD